MKADPAKSKGYLETALKNAGLSSVGDIPAVCSADQRGPAGSEGGHALLPKRPHQAGLKVKLVQATGNQFWTTLYKPSLGYDFAVAGWGPDYDDPITYMGYWNSTSMDMGVTFENTDFDALLLAANKETDPTKRAEILVEGRGDVRRWRSEHPAPALEGLDSPSIRGKGYCLLSLRRADKLLHGRHRKVNLATRDTAALPYPV